VPYRILGRPKSIYSIWNKIKTKKVPFEEIYDLFAVRIIVDVPVEKGKLICWQVYSIVTDVHTPIPERLKDWVTTPKSNGYESLHTTVIGPEGKFVEVQIRTERMDEIAETRFCRPLQV
jgi:guanosine-3',5'-bis(diphosphate) 3'-pyrophosphohydrolase